MTHSGGRPGRLAGSARNLLAESHPANDRCIARSCRPGRREPDEASPSAINPAHPGRVTPLSALLTPRRPLPRCQGSEPCSRASCGPTGAAQRADSWSADRSKTAWYGGWSGFRKRRDQDRFPRPRNPQSEHTVGCSNEGMREHGLGRESHQTRDPDSLIHSAKALRVDSVISNCTGLEVFCCTTIARAAIRSP